MLLIKTKLLDSWFVVFQKAITVWLKDERQGSAKNVPSVSQLNAAVAVYRKLTPTLE